MEVSMVSQWLSVLAADLSPLTSRDGYNLRLNKNCNSKCKDITTIWNKFNYSIF